jgi:hypothetical protein
MNKPIEKFDNIKQAIACMEEWKERLGLHEWIIKLHFAEQGEMQINDSDGNVEYTFILKTARIDILKPQYFGRRIMKYCAERILVHELLHLVFSYIEKDDGELNKMTHQILEDMAMALICTKYGIDNKWFENINYENECMTDG